ncbi:hypothetical protein JL108_02220 [Aeromicrobium sp. YIM 150415]|uniref:hypothetical protein n=1 Tax=Aeromicrobium sp. YIM 150415 TaxID=2803912 RepID=UPI001964AF74|nr:hypothetical protein [Aeromicrobium sp. YIM 150415]MBM9462245.1 hypothetical protein [Aeromicrobium sp. YIM 150415]
MTRVDEFDNFYRATRRRVVATTYALCGDRQVARDASVDAYQRAWRAWGRLRDSSDPVAYVRDQAAKLTSFSRGVHPLRKRHDDGGDTALLGALHDLDYDERRIVTLLTVAGVDLDDATREMQIDDAIGMELASNALTRLEAALTQPLEQLESRLMTLRDSVDTLELPEPDALRRAARQGGRRGAAILVAVSVLAVLAGGFVATNGDALATVEGLPYREKMGAERPDVILDAHNIDKDDLLSLDQVERLNPEQEWKVDATETNTENTTPYSTCPPTRFADSDPLKVFVRAYSTSPAGERVAQSIEVSRSQEASQEAYTTLRDWYANCAHPRTRLIDAYTVKRPFGDFKIIRLQSYRDPARFISVGLAQSGTVTSTLIHEVNGTEPTDVDEFARTLNDSIARVCADSGGECTNDITVEPALPPVTDQYPSFLSVVDMPPLGSIDRVWAAGPAQEPEGFNPAASLCDKTDFSGEQFSEVASRLIAIPDADDLPPEFAVAQTSARLESDDAAQQTLEGIAAAVDGCGDSELSAQIDEREDIDTGGFVGVSWRLSFETGEDERVYYRMGVVRRGSEITQVLAPPSGDNTFTAEDFGAIMERAGQRLAYADE